jgi:putative membrane protein
MLAVVSALALGGAAMAQEPVPTDPQIAHIAWTASQVHVAAARQALAKSKNRQVRDFAEEVVRDHTAALEQARALTTRLGVTPEDNPTSAALTQQAEQKRQELDKLSGKAFDRAYAQQAVALHESVNDTLNDTLIPNAQNPELRTFLETGHHLFEEHELRAEELTKAVERKPARRTSRHPAL